MKVELQAELLRRYPEFFRKPGKRQVHPDVISGLENRLLDDIAPFDERGVECGDGWFDLIDRLSHACENEIGTLMEQGRPQGGWPRIAQIKEKFGGLRFYVRGPLSDDLRAQILQAENEISLCICERCGAPEKLREGRWRRTYCDNCEAEGEANRSPSAHWPA
jgi:hypothetical protein